MHVNDNTILYEPTNRESEFICIQCHQKHKSGPFSNRSLCWLCSVRSGIIIVESLTHREATTKILEQRCIALAQERDNALKQTIGEKAARKAADEKFRQEEQRRVELEKKIVHDQQQREEKRNKKVNNLPPQGSKICSCLIDEKKSGVPNKIKFYIEGEQEMTLVRSGTGTVIIYSQAEHVYLFDIISYRNDERLVNDFESDDVVDHRFVNYNDYYLMSATPIKRTTSNGDVVEAAIFYDVSPGTYTYGKGKRFQSGDVNAKVVPGRVLELRL